MRTASHTPKRPKYGKNHFHQTNENKLLREAHGDTMSVCYEHGDKHTYLHTGARSLRWAKTNHFGIFTISIKMTYSGEVRVFSIIVYRLLLFHAIYPLPMSYARANDFLFVRSHIILFMHGNFAYMCARRRVWHIACTKTWIRDHWIECNACGSTAGCLVFRPSCASRNTSCLCSRYSLEFIKKISFRQRSQVLRIVVISHISSSHFHLLSPGEMAKFRFVLNKWFVLAKMWVVSLCIMGRYQSICLNTSIRIYCLLLEWSSFR